MKFHSILFIAISMFVTGCVSSLKVHQQAYAKLSQEKTFESSFPETWKAIEETVRKFKVVARDPEEVSTLEMKSLKERSLETDWIYSQSRDKYHTYMINSLPRKIYLQTRIKYMILATQKVGGVHVEIQTQEEIESLKEDGSSAGYHSVKQVDTTRGNEILGKIQLNLLSFEKPSHF